MEKLQKAFDVLEKFDASNDIQKALNNHNLVRKQITDKKGRITHVWVSPQGHTAEQHHEMADKLYDQAMNLSTQADNLAARGASDKLTRIKSNQIVAQADNHRAIASKMDKIADENSNKKFGINSDSYVGDLGSLNLKSKMMLNYFSSKTKLPEKVQVEIDDYDNSEHVELIGLTKENINDLFGEIKIKDRRMSSSEIAQWNKLDRHMYMESSEPHDYDYLPHLRDGAENSIQFQTFSDVGTSNTYKNRLNRDNFVDLSNQKLYMSGERTYDDIEVKLTDAKNKKFSREIISIVPMSVVKKHLEEADQKANTTDTPPTLNRKQVANRTKLEGKNNSIVKTKPTETSLSVSESAKPEGKYQKSGERHTEFTHTDGEKYTAGDSVKFVGAGGKEMSGEFKHVNKNIHSPQGYAVIRGEDGKLYERSLGKISKK